MTASVISFVFSVRIHSFGKKHKILICTKRECPFAMKAVRPSQDSCTPAFARKQTLFADASGFFKEEARFLSYGRGLSERSEFRRPYEFRGNVPPLLKAQHPTTGFAPGGHRGATVRTWTDNLLKSIRYFGRSYDFILGLSKRTDPDGKRKKIYSQAVTRRKKDCGIIGMKGQKI